MILGIIVATVTLLLMWASYHKGHYDGYCLCIEDVNLALLQTAKEMDKLE
jgi:hypothetical protein